jgi:hypothetical protein
MIHNQPAPKEAKVTAILQALKGNPEALDLDTMPSCLVFFKQGPDKYEREGRIYTGAEVERAKKRKPDYIIIFEVE